MNFKELCESRYSVRSYSSAVVEKEKIDYILQCAQLAPSACNLQPWFFYIITEKSMQHEIHKAYDREWCKSAPIQIVVCGDIAQSWKRTSTDGKDFTDVDASIAAEHICMAVAEIGLGTCWICNFKPDILIKALNLSSNLVPLAIFPIGYINEEKSIIPEKKRKNISEITQWI